MTPAADIADYLGQQGFASVFISEEPASPSDVVTIYDTGGAGPINVDIDMYEPTIQVRVRSISYTAAYMLQEEIRESLVKPLVIISNNHHYSGVFLQSDIISLGRDQNNRYILTANYRMQRQPT